MNRCLMKIHKIRLLSLTIARSLTTTSRRLENIPYTSDRYPHLKRGNFEILQDYDIEAFKKILPNSGQILSSKDEDLSGYNTDWLKTVRGNSDLVLRPTSAEEISKLLAYCNERKIAVSVQGGNTGLVGGSVPVFDEVILSTERMNRIINFDTFSGVLTCESGCILERLDEYAREFDYIMPYDLGAKGSCQIGGNVSTNAGGLRLLRYGSLHGSVLGLEAVLANGEIIDCLSTLRKDNTGYDLKQLFIGSEGNLGVITKVSILCAKQPKSVNVALLGCPDYNSVLETLDVAKGKLGEILSAFEYMDSSAMETVKNNLGLRCPLDKYPFYCLIETSGSNAMHDEEKLNIFLNNTLDTGLAGDGILATEPSKINALWALRERAAEACKHDGYTYKYDVSIPVAKFSHLVESAKELLKSYPVLYTVGYGHVGDGNIHLNSVSRNFDKDIKSALDIFVFDSVAQLNGSVSAEHGLGFHKNECIRYSKGTSAVKLMKRIKALFDPNCVLNPYKTLSSSVISGI